MNKKLAITSIVAAFIVGIISGAIGGGWTVGFFYNRMTSSLVYNTEEAQIGRDMSALNCLRKNDTTNTIELLETDLDGSIMTLGLYMNDDPKERSDPQTLKILKRAKLYREKFPHKNEGYPEIDQGVSNALLLAEAKTNK